MNRLENLAWVLILAVIWILVFFLIYVPERILGLDKIVFAQELNSKCDVERGRIIQDTAYDAQLYFKLPFAPVWVPAGYFPKGAHLKEIETDGENIVCAFGDLTLAKGMIFSEANYEKEGEKIEVEYRILSGERKNLSLEMTGRLIKVLRTEGNKSVSKTYLINIQDGSAGIQGFFVYLRNGSADSHLVFFPFDNKLYSAKFYPVIGKEGVLYKSFVSPVEKSRIEKTGNENEAIRELFLRVKDGKIIGAEAVFNQRLKIVLTRASE